MIYSARQIADWFLARAALDSHMLTQMKLQKLVYIAHGWNLALYGDPLIGEDIEAWRWGPVVRSLYRDFAAYGSSPIAASVSAPTLDLRTTQLLEQIWKLYGSYTAIQLSAMTHADNTPWQQTYRADATSRISNDTIRRHYRELQTTRK